ncbi:MAG: family 10 glycosylhydrolase [Candidatus Cloacimonetes bacterium]|jgi:uncharacterized lipoprotein YddW (UPF0748 family)|nr:family 10 glycosylhydrolase [Candidatus Cloacimonadota bacterium]MDD3563800.1 family 10 glycosylhydrolase [Candidatus Cloacimonadota bacterium]MDD4277117.1 family 10 glycosylhydrolase [Candidatus Cloacimonadota bacterium]MDY0325802.1 family 10 glycosylhydrolase [Candidatus Cloacimonadaceae bacterium]
MKRFLITLIILGLALGLSAEIRSLWVLPWNIQSKQAIDQVIWDAVYAHQNEILLEVRYRSDALYTPNRLNSKYKNPEPRSYVLKNDGFDPLAYAIEQASAQQIRVQAWVIVFNATPLEPKLVQQNYIYQHHPEWITYNERTERMRSSTQFGYFIDPGIPEVQDYLLDVFSDIVSGYPELYGLHLDYVRYPDAVWGYHPISRRRHSVEGPGLSWNQWRTQQVTEFVEKCRDRIKSINPQIMLSAAVFADINEARNLYAQDWYSWLQEGLIDIAYPMAYQMNYDIFVGQMQDMSQKCVAKDIVVGIRAWDPQGRSLMDTINNRYNINDVALRIKAIREYGFAGIALFSYEGLKGGNALQYLGDSSYWQAPELDSQPLLDRVAAGYPSPEQSWPEEQIVAPAPKQSPPTEKVKTPAPKPSAPAEPIQAPVPKPSPPVEKVQAPVPKPVATQLPSVKANFIANRDMYVIHLEIPERGRWLWELQDENQRRIYHRYRYYSRGDNEDYWDGLLESKARIPSGRYKLILSGEVGSYQADVYLGEI